MEMVYLSELKSTPRTAPRTTLKTILLRISQRVEGHSSNRSSHNTGENLTTVRCGPRRKQASVEAEGASYAYTSLPPNSTATPQGAHTPPKALRDRPHV